jgi:hypothetical protein
MACGAAVLGVKGLERKSEWGEALLGKMDLVFFYVCVCGGGVTRDEGDEGAQGWRLKMVEVKMEKEGEVSVFFFCEGGGLVLGRWRGIRGAAVKSLFYVFFYSAS